MAWMRAVCGRLKSDYRYSKDIVYNYFPWPRKDTWKDGLPTVHCSETDAGKDTLPTVPNSETDGRETVPPCEIARTAQAILDARAKYPDCSLADLYDETVMPPELRKAHQENDRAVMQAYGFDPRMTESEIVAELFRMYEALGK